MRRSVSSIGLALALLGNGTVLNLTATAAVIPAKKSSSACDQGALVVFHAYESARQAVLSAYAAEVSKAKDAFMLVLKTGTRLQRKRARDTFEASKAMALVNRNRALSQLGPKPEFPAACKAS